MSIPSPPSSTNNPLVPLRDLPSLLSAARNGDREAMGAIFEMFRPFLLQIANEALEPKLRQKVGGSDVVQQTLLEAAAALPNFEGDTPEALAAWLRRILQNNIGNLRRHFHADKRNVYREVIVGSEDSRRRLLDRVATNTPSESSDFSKREKDQLTAQALASLPEDYRTVIQLRIVEKKSFQEIGETMQRSPEAARKLWARAIEAAKAAVDELRNASP